MLSLGGAALWAAVFAITVAETWIATWEGKADRNSTSCRTSRWSWRAAGWAGAFELVLLVDIMLIVKEGWALVVPILAGAIYGKFSALERRRAKFRSRTKQAKDVGGSADEDE